VRARSANRWLRLFQKKAEPSCQDVEGVMRAIDIYKRLEKIEARQAAEA
jgi:hypothetical protein